MREDDEKENEDFIFYILYHSNMCNGNGSCSIECDHFLLKSIERIQSGRMIL